MLGELARLGVTVAAATVRAVLRHPVIGVGEQFPLCGRRVSLAGLLRKLWRSESGCPRRRASMAASSNAGGPGSAVW